MDAFLDTLNKRYKSIDFNRTEVHDELIRELRTNEFAHTAAVYRLIALHTIARDVRQMTANQEGLLFGLFTIVDYCRHGKRETSIYHLEFHKVANITDLVKKFSNFFRQVLKQFQMATKSSKSPKQLKRPRVSVDVD